MGGDDTVRRSVSVSTSDKAVQTESEGSCTEPASSSATRELRSIPECQSIEKSEVINLVDIYIMQTLLNFFSLFFKSF